MEIHELMMLTDDEIDYNTLSDDELKELALGDELFIATSALGELENRNGNLGAEVAWEILSNAKGDRYLQSAALETLFQTNRKRALHYMSQHEQNCDHYLLKTVIELIIENPSDFSSGIGWSVSRLARERIKNFKNAEEFIAPELIGSFLKLYENLEEGQVKEADFSQKFSEEKSLSYQILFHPDCRNEFWEIPRKDAVLIATQLYLLQTGSKGFEQVKKLRDANLYKLRAGEYRIIFNYHENRIILLSLGKFSKKQVEAIAAQRAEDLTVVQEKEQSSYNFEMEFFAEVKKRGIKLSELQKSEV
jgi:mRNA-degrading endonuclease RelE of RelBE toxin-antitoxin system